MGHLKWLFTTGELEVDGKSYTPKTKEPKAAKAPQAKPEAKAKASEKSFYQRTLAPRPVTTMQTCSAI